MKNAVIAVVVMAFIGTAFWAGMVYADAGSVKSDVSGLAASGGGQVRLGAAGGMVTEEERAELAEMSDEERQAFMEERFAEGGMTPPSGGMRGARGGLLEGEVIDTDAETITISIAEGGSQTVYMEEDTVIAFAVEGGELVAGAQVMLFSEPAADGVTMAQAVIVK